MARKISYRCGGPRKEEESDTQALNYAVLPLASKATGAFCSIF